LIDALPKYGDRRRTRVGLLGGSFNPAHEGHRHVADLALRRLRLDQVWLLVSPGNPLKPRAGMAPLAQRLAGARRIADGRRVVATAIEALWGARFTIDTLRLLRQRFPRVKFVWVMGADILCQLPRWVRWRRILWLVPFVVLPRPGYTRRALAGKAARCMRHARLRESAAPLLPGAAPGLVLLTAPQNAVSATAIRAGAEGVVP
jgi:nicotinate-nucleotide adenylyltransferase